MADIRSRIERAMEMDLVIKKGLRSVILNSRTPSGYFQQDFIEVQIGKSI